MFKMFFVYQPEHSTPLPIAIHHKLQDSEKCPYIVEMLEWFEENKELIIITELQDPCKTLEDFMSDHKDGVGEAMARDIMRQAVTVAEYSIAHGVSHCSLKLSNVLINIDSKQIKCIGFTWGKLVSARKKADSMYCGE